MGLRGPEAPMEHRAPYIIKVGEAALIALHRVVWHCDIAIV